MGNHATKPPLRVGILLDGFVVRSWVNQIVKDIQSSNYANIQLVIVNGGNVDGQQVTGVRGRIKDAYRSGIFDRFRKFDSFIYSRRFKMDATAPVDLSAAVSGIDTRVVSPIQKKYSDYIRPEDVEYTRQCNLDVLLRFGFRILRGEILQSAKHGVWSYHHGDNREYRGGPALFWEMYERNPVSGVVLQQLTDELDGGNVIYRSLARTEFNSLFANRNPIYWKAARFMPRRLKQLHQFGDGFVRDLTTYREENSYSKPIYRAPTGLQMANFVGRRFVAGLRMQTRKLVKRSRDQQWFCAIRPKAAEEWLVVPNPSNGFYADPFLFERDGRTFLFVERFRFGYPNATIEVGEIKPEGSIDEFRSALTADVHLSYPHVFEHAGEIYMTPETAGARQVRLYRATNFPYEWEQVGVLLDDVVAVDPTVHVHDDRFYLFCNIAPRGSTCDDELHVFIANELQGPWRPHPLNPVVSNVLSSRPAGGIRTEGGRLIRPAQDCSQRYGYAITLNQIDELSETTYQETAIGRILPDWLPNIIGTHMVNETDKFEVRDAQEWRWRWWAYRRTR